MLSVLIVSPHRDDAAFSCAITIRALRPFCSISVANYFTVSEYAPFRQSNKGTVSQIRLREDNAFASLTGIALNDLSLTDAPQRLSIDVAQISTLRPLTEEDAVVRSAIASHIVSLKPDAVLLPLAIGDHIDHRIAQAAALDTGIDKLGFYEDLPYTARASQRAAELRAREVKIGLTPMHFAAPGASQWKRQCAELYPSQIDRTTVAEIANFSGRYGEGERLWVTESAAALFKQIYRA